MTAPPRIPFPVVDEVSRHCLQEREPDTIHIEAHLPGELDPDRLRKAFLEALRRHPRVLVREVPGPWYRRHYEWELTDEPDVEVVSFAPPGPRALRDARTRALTRTLPLTVSPPLHLEVVNTPGPGDTVRAGGVDGAGPTGAVLLLSASHTALDGPTCLRILATTAELYGGRENVAAAPPVRPSGTSRTDPPGISSRWYPPARVAAGTPDLRTPEPGNGLLLAELTLPHRPRGSLYTVNDQLMVATALTLARWNHEHGAPVRPLRIAMPVDDRPRDATMPVGNGNRLVEVLFSPTELSTSDLPGLLRLTALRTRALKGLPSPQLGRGAALLTTPWVPVTARAALTRALRRAAAPWTPSTLLSNVGRVPYPLDFGAEAGRAHAVWLSAPTRMPRGLSLCTASIAGRLHLSLRWSRALLGNHDGARLLDLFTRQLHSTEAPS